MALPLLVSGVEVVIDRAAHREIPWEDTYWHEEVMSNLFRQFIVEKMRDFLDHLDQSHLFLDQGSRVLPEHRGLKLIDAETGGSLALFPESDWSSTSDWCIFVCEEADCSRPTGVYRLISRLPDSEANNEFVAASHLALLTRPTAPEGKSVFVRLLDSGQMTRREMLRMLAGSSEARALDRRVLIIPSPSSWLPEVEADSQGQTMVSVRVAR